MLPERITEWDIKKAVEEKTFYAFICNKFNDIRSHLEEKERNEAEFVKNWNAQSIQLPEEKEYEYPNKNMDCYCEICIYCKEAILKNQQIR